MLQIASSSASAIQFDGFLTTGASWHDDENNNRYIGSLGDRGVTNDASFETDTRFGLQISSDIAENMSVVAQILGTGTDGNFDAIVEWAYADYKFNDWLSVHAGKIKQPVYLVNDYVEVGFAYPWIRPPVEVYYLNNPLNTVNGIEFLLQFPVGPGMLSLQPYFGSNRDDIPNTGGAGFFEAERIRGIDIKYSGRGYSVHASSFGCEVNIEGQMNDVPADFSPYGGAADTPLNINLAGNGRCRVHAAGFNVDLSDMVVYSEWTKRETTDGLSRPFGNQDAWYTTLGYRFGKWLPHVTFASIDGETSTYEGASGLAVTCGGDGSLCGGVDNPLMNFPVAIQTSMTYGLRYEINDSAAFKVEYSVVDVENDPNNIDHPYGINFGLFDSSFTNPPPTDKVGVTSIALEVVF